MPLSEFPQNLSKSVHNFLSYFVKQTDKQMQTKNISSLTDVKIAPCEKEEKYKFCPTQKICIEPSYLYRTCVSLPCFLSILVDLLLYYKHIIQL